MSAQKQVRAAQIRFQPFFKARLPSTSQAFYFLQTISRCQLCRILKTCSSYTSISVGSASKNHTESISHPTNRRCSRRYKHAFAVAKLSAQLSGTSSPTWENLNKRSIIHFTEFCSILCSIFYSKPSVDVLNSRFLGGIHGILIIPFFHHGYFVAIFP